MKPFRRWLGSLLAPADDPRRGAVLPSSAPDALLGELRRSRDELAELRRQIELRSPGSRVAAQLADEEQELVDAEASLLLQMDEQRARVALIRATEARIKAL
jgi:hypothetical protein